MLGTLSIAFCCAQPDTNFDVLLESAKYLFFIEDYVASPSSPLFIEIVFVYLTAI